MKKEIKEVIAQLKKEMSKAEKDAKYYKRLNQDEDKYYCIGKMVAFDISLNILKKLISK